MARKRTRPSRWVLDLVLVFLIALAVKLPYLHERMHLPDVDHPTLDSLFHDEWARGLAFNQWTENQESLRHQPYFRAPLYPYFVSAVYRVFGSAPHALFTVQILMGALTVVLMFYFCSLVFDRRTAWVAAVLQLGYWPFTYHEAERLIPVLSLPLDLLFMVAIVIAGRSGKRRHCVLAGVLAGLSAIARPSILMVVPFAAIWLWRRVGARKETVVASFTLAVLIPILPVTVRNVVRGHDFVFIASQGGVNFFIGNNAQSNGVTAVVPGTRADWWGGFEDTNRIAREAAGRALKPSEVSQYWYERGLHFLTREPRAAGRLYLRKIALFLGNSEPSNERQLLFRRQHSRVLRMLIVNFALLLAVSVIGALELRRAHRPGKERLDRALPFVFAVPYAIGVIGFFVTSRYRLPVAMFLIPVAAAGCVAMWDRIRERAWPRVARTAAVAVVVLILSSLNPFGIGAVADSRGEYGQGLDYFRSGDYEKALRAFNRSLSADSLYAPAWKMRGWLNDRIGDTSAAIRDLQTAVRLDTTMEDAYFRLGVALQKAGQHDRAGGDYLRAIALDPKRVESLNNLADVYLRAGRADDALPYLQRALEVDSTFVNSIYGLGYYYELKGEYDRAAAQYRRAIGYPPARTRLDLIEKHRGKPGG